MLAEYLGARGFEVSLASHPSAGLEALQDGAFDVLILDVMLPETDGFEILVAWLYGTTASRWPPRVRDCPSPAGAGR